MTSFANTHEGGDIFVANNYRHLYSEYGDSCLCAIFMFMRHATRQSLCMAIAMVTDFRVLPRKYRVFDFTFMDSFLLSMHGVTPMFLRT